MQLQKMGLAYLKQHPHFSRSDIVRQIKQTIILANVDLPPQVPLRNHYWSKAGCQIKFTVVNIVRGKLQRLRQKDE